MAASSCTRPGSCGNPENTAGTAAHQMEPLVLRSFSTFSLRRVGVEIVVGEHLAAAVIVDGIAPPSSWNSIGGVGLLFQAFVHRLLGVADLRPAVVPGNFRGGIRRRSWAPPAGQCAGLCQPLCHISFIMLCMNATSSEVSLYFENSSSSVHALEKS